MHIVWETEKERIQRHNENAAMFLVRTLPRFPAYPFPTKAVDTIAQNLTDYFKHAFLPKISMECGVRHPIFVSITAKTPRNDKNLLSIELWATAQIKNKALYDKHIYLYYTDNGTMPIPARKLTSAKVPHALSVGDMTCRDAVTGSEYTLKTKYQKEK